MPQRMSVWWIRGLLAALFALGGEVILWPDPLTYGALDWLLHGLGYVALSAIALDGLARYRLRDLFGVLVLAGAFGLAAGLLFSVRSAQIDRAFSLVTLALGAYTLVGLAALILFLALISGAVGRLTLAGSGLIGLTWGVWVRWGPYDSTLTVLLIGAAIGLGLIALLRFLIRQLDAPPAVLRLNLLEWLMVIATLAGILALGWSQQAYDSIELVISVVLVGYCWMILWFQKPERGFMLLDVCLPVKPLALRPVVLAAGLLLVGGIIGYSLPFDADGQQRDVLIAVLTTFGLVWLPTVSLVIGVRSYRQQARQRKL